MTPYPKGRKNEKDFTNRKLCVNHKLLRIVSVTV